MSRTIAPPRSCARISTSSTRSLVASARSSLSSFERGPGPEHARELRETARRRRAAPAARSPRAFVTACVSERPGGDRGDDVAQPVGPRSLHFPHPAVRRRPKIGPRDQCDRDRRHQRDEHRAGQGSDGEQREDTGEGAPAQNGPSPTPTPACCNQRFARARRALSRPARPGRVRRRGIVPDSAAATSAKQVPTASAATTLTQSSPSARADPGGAPRAAGRGRRVLRGPGGARPSTRAVDPARRARRWARRSGRPPVSGRPR